MTIVVHHLENSRSQRVLWLLDELDLPYEVKRYARNTKTMRAPAELRGVHPLGKAPVIEDGEGTGRSVIAETGAIVEYLVDKAGGALGAPIGRDEAALYRQFIHYAEGSLMPVLFAQLVLGKIPLLGGIVARRFRPMIDVHINYVEAELGRRPWFAGSAFTAADVMMSYPIEVAPNRIGITSHSHPHIFDWLARIHQRPAYKTALSRGGAYKFSV